MQFFEEMGIVIERRWRERNYSELAFPDIAAEALAEAGAIEKVDPQDILRALHTTGTLPDQHKDEFSDLPVTLYRTPRFTIDVYFWLDGTTAIHQHSFSGAFQVLQGSSIHNIYDFEEGQEVSAHFSIGQVALEEVQSLRRGEIRKILPGRRFIHSLFHLDRPSVTLTVRTTQDPNALPQYTYLKPYFSLNPFFRDQVLAKKVDSVLMLLRMGHSVAYSLIDELVSSSDFHTTHLVLSTAFEHLVGQASQGLGAPDEGNGQHLHLSDERSRFHELLKKSRRRHGSLMNFLIPVLGEMQRQRALINLRARVTDSEHRFFLALLLNVDERATILELVRQRFSDKDPVETVCDWVRDLSLIKGGNSRQASVLGLEALDEAHLFVLKHSLEGLSVEQIKSLGGGPNGGGEVSAGEIERAHDSLQRSILLRSIISETTAVIGGATAPSFLGPRPAQVVSA
ncbi:MAG TPA: hypothetical protein VF297_20305 [Pyrinomonadaceae bacterium]